MSHLLSATMTATGHHAPLTWRKALAIPAFSRALLVAAAAGIAVAVALPRFFDRIQGKPGSLMHDPVLAAWMAQDVSDLTFTVIYGTLVIVIASVARSPMRILHGLSAYVLMLLLRMLAMSLFTLEPPPGIIPLVDPFTQVFYPGTTPFLKDLFFSGHTATLTIMILLARKGPVRWFAAFCMAAVGSLVLVQHVHWTVDVLAAVPAAWLAWIAAGAILRKAGLPTSAVAD
ncbi:MAG TPA: phosphatase PAP2-related protein [Flavobacteriales bacterium]|nr:phosphatase PAP2-related protein [Flavobacteriales bacterium]HRA18513.1 phosphatase PAP2-related protein [Flavobacteriales bacterium]